MPICGSKLLKHMLDVASNIHACDAEIAKNFVKDNKLLERLTPTPRPVVSEVKNP